MADDNTVRLEQLKTQAKGMGLDAKTLYSMNEPIGVSLWRGMKKLAMIYDWDTADALLDGLEFKDKLRRLCDEADAALSGCKNLGLNCEAAIRVAHLRREFGIEEGS